VRLLRKAVRPSTLALPCLAAIRSAVPILARQLHSSAMPRCPALRVRRCRIRDSKRNAHKHGLLTKEAIEQRKQMGEVLQQYRQLLLTIR
jgi:hypothetical protein